MLLQKLFCQVFQVSFGEWDGRRDRELMGTLGLDLDLIAELAGTAVNLDPVVKEFFVSGAIEDAIASGLLEVDEEFLGSGGLGSHLELGEERIELRWVGLHAFVQS